MSDPHQRLVASRDADDAPPAATEAVDQETATVMPWIWGGVAILLLAAVIAWTMLVHPFSQKPVPPQFPSSQAAPPTAPPSR
jgi:hypothetical protein